MENHSKESLSKKSKEELEDIILEYQDRYNADGITHLYFTLNLQLENLADQTAKMTLDIDDGDGKAVDRVIALAEKGEKIARSLSELKKRANADKLAELKEARKGRWIDEYETPPRVND